MLMSETNQDKDYIHVEGQPHVGVRTQVKLGGETMNEGDPVQCVRAQVG